MEILLAVILAELVVRLVPGTCGVVRLQVGKTFVDLGLVTNTGNPAPVWVTQRRHQAGGGGGLDQPPPLGPTLGVEDYIEG